MNQNNFYFSLIIPFQFMILINKHNNFSLICILFTISVCILFHKIILRCKNICAMIMNMIQKRKDIML